MNNHIMIVLMQKNFKKNENFTYSLRHYNFKIKIGGIEKTLGVR